jgi:predicted metal-dependent phosphoesterase TrpH
VLKVELHAHSGDDPIDRIPYSTWQLIDRAAALGYDALAVTLHERQLDLRPFAAYAAERGVTLIPGIEKTIEGKHVLLLNFRRGTEGVHSFDDLAALKQREPGIVIAPHAFFPGSSCLGLLLETHARLFDAVEWNAMFTAQLNFNLTALRWAEAHGLPMVGNGDVHRLRQLDTTYSLVDADGHPDAICEAVREGRVQCVANPLSILDAGVLIADLFSDTVGRLFRPAPVLDRPVAAG